MSKKTVKGSTLILTIILVSAFALSFTACSDDDGSNGDDTPDDSIPDSGVNIQMVRIPAGTFTMGSADNFFIWSAPPHQVTLTQGFWMGIYTVTQEQWYAVMGNNPSWFTPDNGRPPILGEVQGRRPVERASWYDAIVFANRLSIRNGRTPAYRIGGSTNPDDWGPVPVWPTLINAATWNAVEIVPGSNGYRLPTEAQWEYAARAGTTTTWSFGDTVANVDYYAWFGGNSDGMTREIGKLRPNPWGLYDMHGNVWEWVWDWWGGYTAEPRTDPTGPTSGANRVRRGGGILDDSAEHTRSAFRNSSSPFSASLMIGFRLVRP